MQDSLVKKGGHLLIYCDKGSSTSNQFILKAQSAIYSTSMFMFQLFVSQSQKFILCPPIATCQLMCAAKISKYYLKMMHSISNAGLYKLVDGAACTEFISSLCTFALTYIAPTYLLTTLILYIHPMLFLFKIMCLNILDMVTKNIILILSFYCFTFMFGIF